MSDTLLSVKNLKVYYPVKEKSKSLRTETKYVKAVDNVSFNVKKGETFGIVGESGCGKSTTGKAIVKLLNPTDGSITYNDSDIFKYNKKENKEFKKEVQIIFQDPYSSLDPRFTVGKIIGEPLLIHGIKSEKERKEKVFQLMRDVGIRTEFYNRYPHEFSGGQRQRIGVARALALNPSLIVCDEPVSALDVSIQAQILNLMNDLQKKYDLTYIFISHNLSVVKHVCDTIAVMYLGNIVELADKKELFNNPVHPYTKILMDAIPIPDPNIKSANFGIEGEIPSPMNPPAGCCFHTRCKYATEKCKKEKPKLMDIGNNHFVACHLLSDFN